jgi:NOL1/NOP2/fmu family ribosome biogenesis protein
MITVRIPLEESWGIQETISEKKKAYGYRFSPDKLNGNALYMACFRKIDQAEETKTKRAYLPKANSKDGDLLITWLKPDSDLIVQPLNDEEFAMQSNHFQDFDILKSKLHLKKAGIRIGKVMGKDIVPHHELALSLINSPETPRLNLTHEQAVAYLKRNEIQKSVDFQGWVLVCYQGHPLGWAKVLHNRINNYFPKELKIANQ